MKKLLFDLAVYNERLLKNEEIKLKRKKSSDFSVRGICNNRLLRMKKKYLNILARICSDRQFNFLCWFVCSFLSKRVHPFFVFQLCPSACLQLDALVS